MDRLLIAFSVLPLNIQRIGSITWAKGHLVRLKEPEEYDEKWKDWSLENLPIIPENFEYVVDEKRKKQFEIVKKKLKAAQQIIWAGDIDREGSYISYIICKVAGVWGARMESSNGMEWNSQ